MRGKSEIADSRGGERAIKKTKACERKMYTPKRKPCVHAREGKDDFHIMDKIKHGAKNQGQRQRQDKEKHHR